MSFGYRKSPRLPAEHYLGPLAAHLVLVTRQRRRVFSDSAITEKCLAILLETVTHHQITLHAYCFMPDHLHLLVEIPEGADLRQFVKTFKQVSGFALKKETGMEPWQISYYDHILRREESLENVANYIWGNPVRAGLSEAIADYPFSGPREMIAQT